MKLRKNILRLIPWIIGLIFFLIPFLWLKPGDLDLGGDSSRLYFYQPLAYLKTQIYSSFPSGIGAEAISYYSIPFVLLLAFVKFFINSSTLLIDLYNGMILSLCFVGCYLSVKELIKGEKDSISNIVVESASMIGGIFYCLAPTITLGWDKAILTHTQIFLNPIMFYLLLRFFLTKSTRILMSILLLTFIFSINFAYVSAPPFFSFYPLSLLFIILYVVFIRKKAVPVIKTTIGFLLFLLLQLFHLAPIIINLFSNESAGINAAVSGAVFSNYGKLVRGLGYFVSVAASVKPSIHLMNLPQSTILGPFSYGFIVFPLIILVGVFLNRKKSILLTGVFFLITLFFVTANITNIGFEAYKLLFRIPGFAMFRNYYGQWAFVYIFFYILLFGQCLAVIFDKLNLKRSQIVGISVAFSVLLILNSIPFIKGDLVNATLYQSKNIKITAKPDPIYQQALDYMQKLPVDGKFLSFPLTDPGYQIISGKDGGAYQGPSTISYLAGRYDFTGYDGMQPFSDLFINLVKNKDIKGLSRLLSILNIKYIFYNSDPKIYDTTFPGYPYSYVRNYMPPTQEAYAKFLLTLPIHKIKDFGNYFHIYEINNSLYLPHIYTSDDIIYSSDPISPYFVLGDSHSLRSVVLEPNSIEKKNSNVVVNAQNINPLLLLLNNYHLHIADPFISRKLNNWFYPFVAWKEKYTLKSKIHQPDNYVTYSLLFLSKRIFELQKYGEDMPIIHKTVFNEPKIWEINKYKNYYSWEASFSRYKKGMEELINWIPTSGTSEIQQKAIKIEINEALNQNEFSLFNFINNSNINDKDKKYLSSRANQMFKDLYFELHPDFYDPSSIQYKVSMPLGNFGKYQIYLKKKIPDELNMQDSSIVINNKRLNPISEEDKNLVTKFSDIDIKNKNFKFYLDIKPFNLINNNSIWENQGDINNNGDVTNLNISNLLGNDNGGLIKSLPGWKPDTQYVITFEYKTYGKDFSYKFYDKRKEKNNITENTYFEKRLNSKGWKKQQTIITSDPNAIEAYMQFLNDSNSSSNIISIRNMSVFEVPDYEIFFVRIGEHKQVKQPNITFVKVNPTKYKILVNGAQNNYTLVFSDGYSKSWKLYLAPDTSLQPAKTMISYFNNQIVEYPSTNIFMNLSTFETWKDKQIAGDKHFIANGYANAWSISSKDVGNRKNYELIMESDSQKKFYPFLIVSFITALVILGIFISTFLKHEKK